MSKCYTASEHTHRTNTIFFFYFVDEAHTLPCAHGGTGASIRALRIKYRHSHIRLAAVRKHLRTFSAGWWCGIVCACVCALMSDAKVCALRWVAAMALHAR